MTMAVSTPPYRPTSDGHCEVILVSGVRSATARWSLWRAKRNSSARRRRPDTGRCRRNRRRHRPRYGARPGQRTHRVRCPAVPARTPHASSHLNGLQTAVPSALGGDDERAIPAGNPSPICPHRHGASHISAFVTHVANAYKATCFVLAASAVGWCAGSVGRRCVQRATDCGEQPVRRDRDQRHGQGRGG